VSKSAFAKKSQPDGIVGMYFHRPTGTGSWNQGQIVACVNADHYLVQFCSWLDGRPTTHGLASVASMSDWRLYRSQDFWRSEGDKLTS
jgi:hypothetical protein